MARNYFPFVLSICASTLSLLLASSPSKIALYIQPSSPVQYIVKGKPLALNCKANSSTNVTLEWIRNSHRVRNEANISQSSHRSVELKIDKMGYEDSGIYTCIAKDTANNTFTRAEKSVDIKVGDLPPEPILPPVLYDVCGYPPKEAFISYQVPASIPSIYPYNVTILLSNKGFACYNSLDTSFKVVDQRIGIFPSSKNRSFSADISTAIKALFPSFRCSSAVECSILCSTVIVSNKFGRRYLKPPQYWELKKEAKCGRVDQLVVLGTTNNSVTVSWITPKCLTNTTYRNKISFWVWCEPKCGNEKIEILHQKVMKYPQSWNLTLRSLLPNTHYKFFVGCSFIKYPDYTKLTTVEAWTKEGVPWPSVVPIITDYKWLPSSSALRGIVFVKWNLPVASEVLLNGKLRSYNLTYQRLNDLNWAKPIEKAVGADVHNLTVPDLKMGNYTFTIKACTRCGCGKASHPYFLFALVTSGSPTETEPVDQNNIILVAVSAVIVVIAVLAIFAICYLCRSRPIGSHNSTTKLEDVTVFWKDDDVDSQTSGEPNIYAIANSSFKDDQQSMSSSDTCSSTVSSMQSNQDSTQSVVA